MIKIEELLNKFEGLTREFYSTRSGDVAAEIIQIKYDIIDLVEGKPKRFFKGFSDKYVCCHEGYLFPVVELTNGNLAGIYIGQFNQWHNSSQILTPEHIAELYGETAGIEARYYLSNLSPNAKAKSI